MSAAQDFKQMAINFLSTLESRIEELESSLLQIESQNNNLDKHKRFIISEIHSIKGNAAAFELHFLKSLCHHFEDVFLEHQDDLMANKTIDNLLFQCDIIKEYIKDNQSAQSEKDDKFFERYKNLIHKEEVKKAEVPVPKINQVELKILTVGIPSSIYKGLIFGIPQFKVESKHLETATAAIEQISVERYDLIVASYILDPIDGITLCLVAKNIFRNSHTKFILLPSQVINESKFSTDPNLVPDKIICKDLEMNKSFAEFCQLNFGETKAAKIAFIDDEEPILELYQSILMDKEIKCLFLNGSEDILSELKAFAPTIIVSDINIPGVQVDVMKNKLETMLKAQQQKVKFIYFTGDPDTQLCAKLREEGAEVYDKANMLEVLLPLSEAALEMTKKKS